MVVSAGTKSLRWRKSLDEIRVATFLRRLRPGLSVSILVGENGAGKSTFLRDVAYRLRSHRNVIAVSNTVYDRFAHMRGLMRISASTGRQLPARILKNAVLAAVDDGLVRLRTIANTLEYCGYGTKIGLRMRYGSLLKSHLNSNSGRSYSNFEQELFERIEQDPRFPPNGDWVDQLRSVLPLLFNQDLSDEDGVWWLDFTGSALDSSVSEQLAKILRWEELLRLVGALFRIEIFIVRHDGITISLDDASSGQLTLIASLVFLAVSVQENSVLLIDEPENSLHPRWQREYVERLLVLLDYRQPTIVIATHAPIIVSGAQLIPYPPVDVFRLVEGTAQLDEKPKGGKESLEETVFEAFGTVTPANHYISENLSNEFAKIRNGETTAAEVATLVEKMRKGSFDQQQLNFLQGIVALAEQVQDGRQKLSDTDA